MNEQEFIDLLNTMFTKEPAPEIEFRLYYDDDGNPLTYTSENISGNYIVVDSQTYAQGRYDCKIIDGEIVFLSDFTYFNKYIPCKTGVPCNPANSLIVDNESSFYWSLKTYTAS